jgi:hypothetical protein
MWRKRRIHMRLLHIFKSRVSMKKYLKYVGLSLFLFHGVTLSMQHTTKQQKVALLRGTELCDIIRISDSMVQDSEQSVYESRDFVVIPLGDMTPVIQRDVHRQQERALDSMCTGCTALVCIGGYTTFFALIGSFVLLNSLR